MLKISLPISIKYHNTYYNPYDVIVIDDIDKDEMIKQGATIIGELLQEEVKVNHPENGVEKPLFIKKKKGNKE